MKATISRWGNSLALRIPKAVARDHGLKCGSVVYLVVRKCKVVVEPARETPKYTLRELVAGITKENLHGSVDTGHSVGQEAWGE